jgi:hypothetical protein
VKVFASSSEEEVVYNENRVDEMWVMGALWVLVMEGEGFSQYMGEVTRVMAAIGHWPTFCEFSDVFGLGVKWVLKKWSFIICFVWIFEIDALYYGGKGRKGEGFTKQGLSLLN